jgi:hypothetical protein
MKTINVTFTEDEYAELTNCKGERTWRESIMEEFGIAEAAPAE